MDKRIVLAVYCILFLITGIAFTLPFGVLILFTACFAGWIFYLSILHFWGENDRPPAPLAFSVTLATAMKEGLLKSRLCRLIVAICCTVLSYMGLLAALHAASSSPQDLLSYLWGSAWVAYFLILFFWIKNDRAPKPLMVTGTALGCCSVAITVGWALIHTFPAVALMIYVYARSFDTPQAA